MMFYNSRVLWVSCLFLSLSVYSGGQNMKRPLIWVSEGQRIGVLNKIENEDWAKEFYLAFKGRLDNELLVYHENRDNFLKVIPLEWPDKTEVWPTFQPITEFNSNENRLSIIRYLQLAVDCTVIYYLTNEEQYAQCAADILYVFLRGLENLEPSNELANGGWIYPNDHLREAREIGSQLPIIYDFIDPFIKSGGRPYDPIIKNSVEFPFELGQNVFRTYANLVINHGHTGSNWSVLEAPSLIQNAMALQSKTERDSLLDYFLYKGNSRQESLPEIFKAYEGKGSVYPESSQYSNAVASLITKLLVILNNYNPTLELASTYEVIPFSLKRWNDLRYPNREMIRFGDGHRTLGVPYESYELAYKIGKENDISDLKNTYGHLLRKAIEEGAYARGQFSFDRSLGAHSYFDPLPLLWFTPDVDGSIKEEELPRTDHLPHAGVYLQRNISSTKYIDHDLMCFVGGGHYVHGHADGMDMELYGLGEVLGVDNGRGQYRTDIHENYSRLFAAHNTVIVNGSSKGEGQWVNLGINKTTLKSMEPKPHQVGLSPYHSFTITNFVDDKGDGAEAQQQRLMAIVRTSPTSGYYIDVFRSRSSLPNQYHDYLYHNFGDKLEFLTNGLNLSSTPDRYPVAPNSKVIPNRSYNNPGWHFFRDVETSTTFENDVKAQFRTSRLKDGKIRFMKVYIANEAEREYTRVSAPPTFEAPKPYDELATPTLAIRQKGQAWSRPFAIIYEPTLSSPQNHIIAFEKLWYQSEFGGFKIKSEVDGSTIVQYVIIPREDQKFEDGKLGIVFNGAFAVITINNKEELMELYVGDAKELIFRNKRLYSKDESTFSAYLNNAEPRSEIKSTDNLSIELLHD